MTRGASDRTSVGRLCVGLLVLTAIGCSCSDETKPQPRLSLSVENPLVRSCNVSFTSEKLTIARLSAGVKGHLDRSSLAFIAIADAPLSGALIELDDTAEPSPVSVASARCYQRDGHEVTNPKVKVAKR